jgi:hypothetical protein
MSATATDLRKQPVPLLNRIAFNLLKQCKASKRVVHGKRLKAVWNNGYLLHLPEILDAFAPGGIPCAFRPKMPTGCFFKVVHRALLRA